jgi:sialidase-1
MGTALLLGVCWVVAGPGARPAWGHLPGPSGLGAAAPPDDAISQPFRHHEGGYACYRIPAVVTTNDGTLLAFAEGRVADCSDVGNIDLVLRRSFDGGRTWGPMDVLRGEGDNGGFGNPVPVVDADSGRISLLFAYNTWTQQGDDRVRGPRSLHALVSTSDGADWEDGEDLADLKPATWTWVSTGPGHGVQLRHGEHAGRIIVPGDHDTTDGRSGAQLYYSDDGGLTWELGAVYDTTDPTANPGELTVAERADGSLYVNARAAQTCGTRDHRLAASSLDGGASFTAAGFTPIPNLDTPPVSGSLLSLGDRMLFSAPARPGLEAVPDRRVMSIRSSYDDGATWETSGTVIHPERAGYSDLTLLENGDIGLLYETGEGSSHGTMNFTAFSESELDEGETELRFPRTSDSSGNGNHAVVHGGAELGSRGSGSAILLGGTGDPDGEDDYLRLINCPSSLDLGSGDFSVAAWIRYGDGGGAHPIVWGYGQGAGDQQFWLRAEPAEDRIRAAIDTGSGSASVSTSQAYNDNAWHHVVFSRADGRLSLVVDGGQPVSAAAPAGDISPSGVWTIHLGARPDYAELFHGGLDDVRIYGRALSAGEIDRIRAGATDVTEDERLRLGFTAIW